MSLTEKPIRFLLIALCLGVPTSMVSAQLAGPADPASAGESPIDSPALFVPVVPGVPAATPVPTPVAPQTVPPFIPSEIPAPAIQSQPVTYDLIDNPPSPSSQNAVPGQVPVVPAMPAATPQPMATPKPTPRPPARPAAPATMSQAQISALAEKASSTQDGATATRLGWAYYNRNDFSSAAFWFEQAVEWSPRSGEAAYGLALSKFRSGDLSTAESIAGYRMNDYPKMRTLLGDIYVRRAVDSYEGANYKRSLDFFERAKQYRALSRNEQIIESWDYFRTGQTEEAAKRFEQLYRRKPDNESAEGLYAALSKLGDYDRLNLIAEEVPGPLMEVYSTFDAQKFYQAGLFRAAYDANGEKVVPALENFTSPAVEAGFSYRQKSGQEGESALTEIKAPYIEARFYPSNKTEIVATIGRLLLDAGDLPPGARFGTPPPTFTPYSFTPTTQEDDLFEFSIRFSYESWISPYVEIGTTPLNGPLQARPIGKAGAVYRHSTGYIQGEFYSRSIKESMLSYVGAVDPYTGKTWGRVTETGFAASVFQSVAQDWTVYLGGSIGQITGDDVATNDHVAGTVAIAKDLKLEGFEYFTLGPAFSYETFANNQNFFTYGNGGYFSPEYLVQGVISANFLTKEGRDWLVRGAVSAGLQSNQQASAPYFPNNPDGQTYPGTSSSTGIFLLDLGGAMLIDSNWLVGATAAYNVTADYNEGWASIYVRYFFEKRAGLFRSDLNSGY